MALRASPVAVRILEERDDHVRKNEESTLTPKELWALCIKQKNHKLFSLLHEWTAEGLTSGLINSLLLRSGLSVTIQLFSLLYESASPTVRVGFMPATSIHDSATGEALTQPEILV